MSIPDIPTVVPAARSSEQRDLFTLPAAADRLSISRRTLDRLISAGSFPRPVKVGSSSRVLREDIEGYLEQLRRARGDKIGMS
jgi:excisionase family DNA binding protein